MCGCRGVDKKEEVWMGSVKRKRWGDKEEVGGGGMKRKMCERRGGGVKKRRCNGTLAIPQELQLTKGTKMVTLSSSMF